MRAGESFVVHAPEVPVAIAFDASHKCGGQVALDLATVAGAKGKQRGQGEGRANLLFPAGTRGYTARCVDEICNLPEDAGRASGPADPRPARPGFQPR